MSIILFGQGEVSVQGRDGALITGVWRFHLGQDGRYVGCVHDMIFYEFGQVVFFGLNIQVEIKMLGIHFADVKIGDIAHEADGERDVELHRVGFRGIRG